MQSQVQKWRNSLAVRIPKVYADELGLDENSPIELQLEDGKLTIALKIEFRLEDLVAQITDENKHEELETGDAQGMEYLTGVRCG